MTARDAKRRTTAHDARDWLEMVRDCAGELDGMHQELLALIDARDACLPWRTKGSPMYGSMGGSCSNPTQTEALSRIVALDDQIATLTTKVDESERVVGDCLAMLDAMWHELGERYAKALEIYYIDCADTWSEVALEMGMSRTHLCRIRDAAWSWADAYIVQHGI